MNGKKDQNNNNDMVIPDTEAVQLFINLYKLLFLGSKFAQKMLKLQIDKQDKHLILVEKNGSTTDEERMSDGPVINDTSDVISSDYLES